MSYNEDVVRSIRHALHAAGVGECREKVSKSTGRVRYWPGYDGFQILLSLSTPTLLPMPSVEEKGKMYIGVGHREHPMKILRRYATILQEAGFDVVVCATRLHPSVPRVWVVEPWMKPNV
jgi:hypothetical protein